MAASRGTNGGSLDFSGYYTPNEYGAALTVEAKVKEALSLYAQGQIGWDNITRSIEKRAFGGLRLTW